MDDSTIILADMAEKAIRQVKATVNGLLRERMGVERAEQIVYSSVTTGAENDLKQVSQIMPARLLDMETISKWGLRPVARHRRQFCSGSGYQHDANFYCVLAKKRSTPVFWYAQPPV